MNRLIVVSAHLDDGVFSCGTLIATVALLQPAVIVTVFAGIPSPATRTTLDRAAGFRTSRDAVLARRIEDANAAETLGGEHVHLDLLDAQYGAASTAAQVWEAVADHLLPEDVVVAPVGICHQDHIVVAAALRARADLRYEDIPYRNLWPELAPALDPPILKLQTCSIKRAAISCYVSQLGGEIGESLDANERYHR